MPVPAGFDGTMLRNAGFLAQAWESIVLAQESDHRAAFACFADDGGWDAGNTLGEAEGFCRKHFVSEFQILFSRISVAEDTLFKGRHFDRSVILLCVRWYLA